MSAYYLELSEPERDEERSEYQREVRDLWPLRNTYPVRAAIRNAIRQLRSIEEAKK